MYFHKSVASKVRMSPVFAQPATSLEAGNGVPLADGFRLHPATANSARHEATIRSFLIPFLLSLSPCFASVQQNLVGAGTTFPNAGHINRRPVLHRAGVFAGAASHAPSRIEIWLLHLLDVAGGIAHVGRAQEDCLRRCRTPLFADNALGSHGPGQAPAAIVERGSQPDRLCSFSNIHRPALLF